MNKTPLAQKAVADTTEDSARRQGEPHLGRLGIAPGFLLRRASALFAKHHKQLTSRAGIPVTGAQGGMLMLIDENPGLTQIELARLMAVEGSTLSQGLNRLVNIGYVRRYRLPEDQRAFALHLTRKGRSVMEELAQLTAKNHDDVMCGLSVEERDILIEMLQRLIACGERSLDS